MPPEEAQKEVQEKPRSKKLLIIIPLLLVLLGGGGAGAYFKFVKAPAAASVDEKKQIEGPVYYEMDTFLVNLADPGGKRFLKTTMKLKVSSPVVAEECKSRNFEMKDLILTLLSSKECSEVISPEDKLILKKQIMDTLNRMLQKGQALDVYFTEFLVQ
ncbi:MAG: flagellar basal body-associated FliL family protein [Syntrophobacteraceae bacterium]|jgi:flagellar FliL protein